MPKFTQSPEERVDFRDSDQFSLPAANHRWPSLQETDPVFFDIVCGIVADDMHSVPALNRQVNHLLRRRQDTSRSVNAKYRIMDAAEQTFPYATHEITRAILNEAIETKTW